MFRFLLSSWYHTLLILTLMACSQSWHLTLRVATFMAKLHVAQTLLAWFSKTKTAWNCKSQKMKLPGQGRLLGCCSNIYLVVMIMMMMMMLMMMMKKLETVRIKVMRDNRTVVVWRYKVHQSTVVQQHIQLFSRWIMDFQYADIGYYTMRDQKTSEKIVVSWHRSSGRSSGDATTAVSWIQYYANHNHPLQPLENAQMPEKIWLNFTGIPSFLKIII